MTATVPVVSVARLCVSAGDGRVGRAVSGGLNRRPDLTLQSAELS